MQTAAIEATYPILAKIMWDKTYEAALATPVTIPDLIRGEVVWTTIRMFIVAAMFWIDRKSTRLNSSHITISYAVFCLKKKKKTPHRPLPPQRDEPEHHPSRTDL